MPIREDVTGQRFARLTVIGDVYPSRPRKVVVRCDCGSEKTTYLQSLKRGTTRSCGCLLTEIMVSRNKEGTLGLKHGLHKHPLYTIWCGMMQRCHNPNHVKSHLYGGRGIQVTPQWHDVREFVTWIESNLGPRLEGYSLDRIDGDRGYEPGNLRWATALEQRHNRRSTLERG